jgi:hypothetical protein
MLWTRDVPLVYSGAGRWPLAAGTLGERQRFAPDRLLEGGANPLASGRTRASTIEVDGTTDACVTVDLTLLHSRRELFV